MDRKVGGCRISACSRTTVVQQIKQSPPPPKKKVHDPSCTPPSPSPFGSSVRISGRRGYQQVINVGEWHDRKPMGKFRGLVRRYAYSEQVHVIEVTIIVGPYLSIYDARIHPLILQCRSHPMRPHSPHSQIPNKGAHKLLYKFPSPTQPAQKKSHPSSR